MSKAKQSPHEHGKIACPEPLAAFGRASAAWFCESFQTPTPVQAQGWDAIGRGEHALLLAPTGSGKTLAAFFYALDALSRLPSDAPSGTRVLYVSPLKALVSDIERNLRAPLVGIARHAERLGDSVRPIRVGVRTGDTPAKERARARKDPPDILVTTPESLFLLLGSGAKETLKLVSTIIVDEIHALAPTKRGAHLALSIERLEQLCATPPQRIGLSATVKPHHEAARFLAGTRPVTVVDYSSKPRLHLQLEVPCDDMQSPPAPSQATPPEGGSILGALAREDNEKRTSGASPTASREYQGMWAVLYPRILALIAEHTSTIVFVNSRSLCERMAHTLNELAGESWVRAHHGSVSRKNREAIEEALKTGQLRGIVATSSLELGIDMGSIDLVVLVESPGSIARGLQRVGRAGHAVGQQSQGMLFPKHKGDLLEAMVVSERMRAGDIEPIAVPQCPLDIAAQHIVAHVAQQSCSVDELFELVRRAAPFASLSKQAFLGLIDMHSGAFADDQMAELRPLISHDRLTDRVEARKQARLVATLNAGTIIDRGLFGVFLVGNGPRVGELDEEMVNESRKGDVFTLGASSWRIEEITRDQVRVTPAPGQPGRLPFWRGEGPGRPLALGRAMGALVRELLALPASTAHTTVQERFCCNEQAATNALSYVRQQQEANGCVPSDVAITIERFVDEVGDLRICILSPLGVPVHAPWALLLEAQLSERLRCPIDALYTDDGICLRIGVESLPETGIDVDWLVPDAQDVTPTLTSLLGHSSLFASYFRENATRALLLPKRRAQGRAPLWQQRLRAKTLLSGCQRYPRFPMVLETYRQLLRDVFDIPGLEQTLGALVSRRIRIDSVERNAPSPMARSLAFAYQQTYLYEADAPAAERQAQALALDYELLRELLGESDLRDMLDASACDDVESALQARVAPYTARDANELLDLLRRIGDLTLDEIVERIADLDVDVSSPRQPKDIRVQQVQRANAWVQELKISRRATELIIAEETRVVALEDVARFRDGLGTVVPSGLPSRYLTAAPAPIEGLLTRYARTHGPFSAQNIADRFGLSTRVARDVCEKLAGEQRWAFGALDPRHEESVYCHPDVVRKLKRATLERVRHRVAALEPRALAHFLPAWQGVTTPASGPGALLHAIDKLAGISLPFSALVNDILPARVASFVPEDLDRVCAEGRVAWVGDGALGPRDGRVRLFLREQLPLLLSRPAAWSDAEALHTHIVTSLRERGPAFFSSLVGRLPDRPKTQDVERALWDLAWKGIVTNDTIAPLRHVTAQSKGRHRKAYSAAGVGGRWSLVEDELGPDAPAETVRQHAIATTLLSRWGIVAKEMVAAEAIFGGFSKLYPMFASLEDNGRVRRGLFVEHLGAAQFGLPAAIERLRSGYQDAVARPSDPIWLAAIDPAQPYGIVLSWPELATNSGRPLRRVAQARVLLWEGLPIAYLEANGRKLWRFRAAVDHDDILMHGLRALAARQPSRSVVVTEIDGVASLRHDQASQWLQGGMHPRFDGLAMGMTSNGSSDA